jgi:hypothetical protein
MHACNKSRETNLNIYCAHFEGYPRDYKGTCTSIDYKTVIICNIVASRISYDTFNLRAYADPEILKVTVYCQSQVTISSGIVYKVFLLHTSEY